MAVRCGQVLAALAVFYSNAQKLESKELRLLHEKAGGDAMMSDDEVGRRCEDVMMR